MNHITLLTRNGVYSSSTRACIGLWHGLQDKWQAAADLRGSIPINRGLRKPRNLVGLPAILGVLVMLAATPADANQLINGSFEDDPLALGVTTLTGWSVLDGTVDVGPSMDIELLAKDGDQYLETVGTPGHATVAQSFSTVPGQLYAFTGWIAHHPGIGDSTAIADVYIDDVWIGDLSHSGTFSEWRPFEHQFTATSATTELKLQDVTFLYDFGGLFLDNLAINAVPEPSSLALTGIGMAVVVFFVRRRAATALTSARFTG